MTFDEHCERLMLVDTIQFGLHVTHAFEGQTNLCPEEVAIQVWRVRAHVTLALEARRRPPCPGAHGDDGGVRHEPQ